MRPLSIQPIPYQGSKRKLAPIILEYFPESVATLYEPFAGSAAITLAAARWGKAERFHLGDSLEPLVELWRLIVDEPEILGDVYEALWRSQHADPRGFYNEVRAAYNASPSPGNLLFLLARCVKNAVRFNAAGEFNQSPDNRRRGTRPDRMRKQIAAASKLLTGRSEVTAGDYSTLLRMAGPNDLVYMDPPWQGTSGSRDQRYHRGLEWDRFVRDLDALRSNGVPFLISFDGRCGNKTYGQELPDQLGLTRVELHAGRSSQATLAGRNDETVESLYLSPELVRDPTFRRSRSVRETLQMSLPLS